MFILSLVRSRVSRQSSTGWSHQSSHTVQEKIYTQGDQPNCQFWRRHTEMPLCICVKDHSSHLLPDTVTPSHPPLNWLTLQRIRSSNNRWALGSSSRHPSRRTVLQHWEYECPNFAWFMLECLTRVGVLCMDTLSCIHGVDRADDIGSINAPITGPMSSLHK